MFEFILFILGIGFLVLLIWGIKETWNTPPIWKRR